MSGDSQRIRRRVGRGLTRHHFFDRVGGVIHGRALATLLGPELFSSLGFAGEHKGPAPLVDSRPTFATTAVRGEGHSGDSFVHEWRAKPDGSVRSQAGARSAPWRGVFQQDRRRSRESAKRAGIMRSPFKFAQHGQMRHVGLGRAAASGPPSRRHGTHPFDVHDESDARTGHLSVQTGKMGSGRPDMGSWVVYGLGSENQNLPAYVVLDDPLGLPINGVDNWQAGFLPPLFQGTRFRSTGSPVFEPASRCRNARAELRDGAGSAWRPG